MPAWKKRVYKLDANHKWKAKPGYQIFVADWGAVRFDIPTGWVPVPVEISVRLCDKEPPDNDAALEVSVTHLAPIDWSDLSLAYLLRELLEGREARTGHLAGRDCRREARRPGNSLEVDSLDRPERAARGPLLRLPCPAEAHPGLPHL